MDTGVKPGVFGEVAQRVDEVRVVGGAEETDQLRLQGVGGLLGMGQQLAAGVGQAHRVGSTIAAVGTSLDQAPGLEIIDEADHDVAVDAQGIGELLLSAPLTLAQVG